MSEIIMVKVFLLHELHYMSSSDSFSVLKCEVFDIFEKMSSYDLYELKIKLSLKSEKYKNVNSFYSVFSIFLSGFALTLSLTNSFIKEQSDAITNSIIKLPNISEKDILNIMCGVLGVVIGLLICNNTKFKIYNVGYKFIDICFNEYKLIKTKSNENKKHIILN